MGVGVLKIFIEVTEGGSLSRDHVCAYLFSKLSKKYHDDGLGKYFNGSGVKAHTFRMPYRKTYDRGEVFPIELRGIEPIESKFSREIRIGELVRFGKLRGSVVAVTDVPYVMKDSYEIFSPVVLRFGCRDRFDELGLSDDRLNVVDPCLVPSMGVELWEGLIGDGIRRRAELIYGIDVVSEFGDVRVFARDVRDVVVDVTMKGNRLNYLSVLGDIVIEGDAFWHDFIQRVGIGNRNTYGLGVVG